MADRRRRLEGWGKFPRLQCDVVSPVLLDDLRGSVRRDGSMIARGLGRSYGDSSLNSVGVVIDQTHRRRFLSFDDESGVLRCEAGVSLAEIIECLLPRGWFLPTTPGTKFVTVGGAIAADVHGKNHHVDGSIGAWIRGLTLLLASGEVITCSPDQNPDVFWATVGGMGLTGIILDAEIQLVRTPSAFCSVKTVRTGGLDETLSDLLERDAVYRYSVAWVDCLAKGAKLGRSVIMYGNDADPEALGSRRDRPYERKGKLPLAVPITPPFSFIGPASVKAFNAVYYAAHGSGDSIADYESFFYPLDHVRNWNRLYGPRGFIQYQALFPRETASEGLRELLELLSAEGAASFLAVLKRSGARGRGVLSYLFDGYTLALDIPHQGADLQGLVSRMDEVLLRSNGRVYLAKDSTTTAEAFRVMYPELERFKEIKSRIDPEQKFRSAQSDRLGITDHD